MACGLLLAAAGPQAFAADAMNPASYSGPFAALSPLPYHLPAFDKITDADFAPAFEAGMAQQRIEVDAIAANKEAPSFENTIVALDISGQVLTRVGSTFFNLASANTDPAIEKLQAEMAPKLAAHGDAINLNAALYARIKSLYEKRASLNLDAESARLLDRYHTQFVRAGAELAEADKTRLKSMNEQLSTLTNQFRQNVLEATKAGAVVVDSAAELKGLDAPLIAAAAEAAKGRGLAGKWLLPLQNTTTQPALGQLQNRALRERLYRASISRASSGKNANQEVVAKIVSLRAERAALLGYPNHAAYVLADETAHDTTAVNKILGNLAPAAMASAKKDAIEIQKVIDAEAKANHTASFKVQPWDWDYYSEAVRKAKYAYDESEVRPYFELNNVLQNGVFYAATQLYGITFKERKDLPVYQKDVRVFEVFNADGSPLALFLADYYARDNKQGGAWMNSYVDQSSLMGTLPVVANHLNIPKPPEGEPTLLSFDFTQTLFHEFGHALHGMFSNIKYPLLSGTSVPRDFVEYPSQFNEMWASDPKVVANFAKHYKTGEPIPQALLEKVRAASKFNQGFDTGETLVAMLLDQSWHQLPAGHTPAAADVMKFEAAALKKDGVDYYAVPPRYHTPYFNHIFAGGYSAGYYAYLWTAVLAADTEQWMKSHGGLQRANGDYFRAKVLSRGGSVDAGTLFREFYGAEPDVAPLVEKRGLTLVSKPSGKMKGKKAG